MNSLSSRQRAQLRQMAHSLKPVLRIGKEGVTPAAVQALREAFNTRELLKVKVQEAAPGDAGTAGASLAEAVEGAHLVQTIGRTAVLYRTHPERPQIRLA